MTQAESGDERQSLDSAPSDYFGRMRVLLVTVLAVICVAIGALGWYLHPRSNGFQSVPQDLGIVVPSSEFNMTETLTPTAHNGATLTVSDPSGPVPQATNPTASGIAASEPGPIPFENGAQVCKNVGGAAQCGSTPVAAVNGVPIANNSWSFIVLNPHGAKACSQSANYRSGNVTLPLSASDPALVIPRQPPIVSTDPSYVPTGICLHWDSGAPINLRGAYLSARFPPIQGISSNIFFTGEPMTGDLATHSVTRSLGPVDGPTANFSIQTDPQPTDTYGRTWAWVTEDSPQVIQVAAVNTSELDQENNNAFVSGILFGVAGGALVTLITELVMPFYRRSADE